MYDISMKTTRKDMLKTATAAAAAALFLPLASRASTTNVEDQCIEDWAAFHARWCTSYMLNGEVYDDGGQLYRSSPAVVYAALPGEDKSLCTAEHSIDSDFIDCIEIPAKVRRVYVSSADTPAEVWRPELEAQLKKFLAEEAHKTLKHLEGIDFTVWPETKKLLDWIK